MRYTVEKEIMMTHIGDEAVLLNINNGRYFSLNKTAEQVWDLLIQFQDTEKVLNAMMEKYDVDEAILQQDIRNIIFGLADAELVIIA